MNTVNTMARRPSMALLASTLLVGCGSAVTVAGEVAIECHAGFELRDGVCTIQQVYIEGGSFIMGRGLAAAIAHHPPSTWTSLTTAGAS